jgi:putative membrane protein
MTTVFAFLHHLFAFALVGALAAELVLLRQQLTLDNARRLLAVDAMYGASAGFLLIAGFARVFFLEKGYLYYFTSHAFLTKLGVFILVGLASVVPTIEFLKWRKSVKAGQVPNVEAGKLQTIRRIVHWELAGIVLILLLAAMAARGGWV